jgi:hypothetical protein
MANPERRFLARVCDDAAKAEAAGDRARCDRLQRFVLDMNRRPPANGLAGLVLEHERRFGETRTGGFGALLYVAVYGLRRECAA